MIAGNISMKTDIKTVKLKLYLDESDRAIFSGIGDDRGKWFSKTANGDWCYTCSHKGLWELDGLVKAPYRFLICGNRTGDEYAVDSNVPELATKPFVSMRDIEKQLREQYLKEEGTIEHEQWAGAILDGYFHKEGFVYDPRKRDIYIYSDVKTLNEEIVGYTEYEGEKREIKKLTREHLETGIKYEEYVVEKGGFYCWLCVYKILK